MRSLVFLAFTALACSASTSGPGGVVSDGAIADDAAIVDDSSTTSDGGGGKDGTVTDAGGTDAGPSMPYCRQTCATASDCATASAAYDADNYACESKLCVWKGCNSDAECQSSFSSTAYVCKLQLGIKTCLKKCTTPADCAVASAAYDADNYACESNTCRYTGCNNDTECAALGSGYVCRKLDTPGLDPSLNVATCVKGCSKPADCATASVAYDADNYACESGACKYIGCNSDSECQSAFSKSNYTCK